LVAESTSSAAKAFQGSGQSLSGKPTSERKETKQEHTIDDLDPDAEPVPLDLPSNQLFFGFPVVLPTPEESEEENANQASENAFSGSGQSLRQSKKRKDKTSNHPSLKNHSRSPDYIEID